MPQLIIKPLITLHDAKAKAEFEDRMFSLTGLPHSEDKGAYVHQLNHMIVDGRLHDQQAERVLARLQSSLGGAATVEIVDTPSVDTVLYRCGCSATGVSPLPGYCPEHEAESDGE